MFDQINLVDKSQNLETVYAIIGGDKTFSAKISTKSISLSVLASSLTGTLDATVKIYGANTDNIDEAVQVGSTITLSTATYVELIETDNWKSAYMFIKLEKNNCMSGNLKLPITFKN
ncbi:MAG: hypothetical protein GY849_02355 [Deltaproteobacteria bacterium]|nr:hypothetical protein [Deltaproteobacteria bacterium]